MSVPMIVMVVLVGVLLLVVWRSCYRLWKLRQVAARRQFFVTSPPSAVTAGATA